MDFQLLRNCYHVQRRLYLLLYQNICHLIGVVILCNWYEAFEGGCSCSCIKTSAIWLGWLSCATGTKPLKVAVAAPVSKHLPFDWVVILCNWYEAFEGGCSCSCIKTSAIWLGWLSCATGTKPLKEAIAAPVSKYLPFDWGGYPVQLVRSLWRWLQLLLYQNICHLIGVVILCNWYEAFEGGCSWSTRVQSTRLGIY